MDPRRYASANVAAQASASSQLLLQSTVSEAEWDQENLDQDQGQDYDADNSNNELNLMDKRSLELQMWLMERKAGILINRRLEPFKEQVPRISSDDLAAPVNGKATTIG